MLAALHGTIGLIFIPVFGVFVLIEAFSPGQSGAANTPGIREILMLALFPLVYAVMGFIAGIIGAAIYNLFAKWIGGIEVEVE
ncbi:MAG TPA: hypothetical protein VF585_00150 [Chthoniobacterales bacterium]